MYISPAVLVNLFARTKDKRKRNVFSSVTICHHGTLRYLA